MTHPHLITDAAAAREFMFGGKARFTLVSKETGKRFTFRVAKRKPDTLRPERAEDLFFASVLTGPDNGTDYQYIGYSNGGGFSSGRKGNPSHPAFKALAWTEANLRAKGVMPDTLEFWHEGRCAKCARPLTDPVSIQLGLGPECAKKDH